MQPSRLVSTALPVAIAAMCSVAVFSARQPAEFARLFAQYRGAEAEQAVRAFAAWSAVRVTRETTLPADTEDLRTLAARALFHLEAGLRNETFGRTRADVESIANTPWSERAEPHYRIGQPIIERVLQAAQRAGDAALLGFCRHWYIVANTAGPGIHTWGRDFDTFRQRAADDAEMQIVVGAKGVLEMGPQ